MNEKQESVLWKEAEQQLWRLIEKDADKKEGIRAIVHAESVIDG